MIGEVIESADSKMLKKFASAEVLEELEANARSKTAGKGGEGKREKSLKHKEKLFVYECWKNWKERPEQYKNKTKFATAMIEKFKPDNPDEDGKHLNSVKVITAWCSEWEKMQVY
jgi:hypothetical protein